MEVTDKEEGEEGVEKTRARLTLLCCMQARLDSFLTPHFPPPRSVPPPPPAFILPAQGKKPAGDPGSNDSAHPFSLLLFRPTSLLFHA